MNDRTTPLRDPRALLTAAQLQKLRELEQAAQSAIEALHDEEKRLGVFNPGSTQTPRWSKP